MSESTSTAHMIYEATARQIAGLELERQAHLRQIAGLVAERDALRADNRTLATALDRSAARAYAWRKAYAGDGQPPENRAPAYVHSPGYPQEDAETPQTQAEWTAAWVNHMQGQPDLVRVPILGSVDSATGTVTWNA